MLKQLSQKRTLTAMSTINDMNQGFESAIWINVVSQCYGSMASLLLINGFDSILCLNDVFRCCASMSWIIGMHWCCESMIWVNGMNRWCDSMLWIDVVTRCCDSISRNNILPQCFVAMLCFDGMNQFASMLWLDVVIQMCASMMWPDAVGRCCDSILWIDVAATPARELRVGSNSVTHRLCGAYWKGQPWLFARPILPRTGCVCLWVPFFEAIRTL